MPDIVDMLQALPHAVTPGPPWPDLAAADVARGHRALGQRRQPGQPLRRSQRVPS